MGELERRKITFSPPDISESEIEEVGNALRSGWITTGPRTKLLERRLAAYIETGDTKYDTESDPERWSNRVVCLNSATAAEELNLRILGIKEGDEVIVPAYTYTATASAAIHCGATVKFVDNNSETTGMLKGYADTMLENSGTLEIAVDIEHKNSSYMILNNAGTVKMSAGNISATGKGYTVPEGQVVIQNSGAGTIELSGASVTYNQVASSTGRNYAYGYLINCVDIDENEYSNITLSAGTITALYNENGQVINAKHAHISLSGGSITGAYILKCENSTLDITGGGSIIGPENVNAYGIWLRAATSSYTPVLNIYDGTIIGATHTLYAESGIINVYGGTFKMYEFESTEKDVNGNFKFLLNCLDENYRNGTAQINVYGGTFWDFNPAEAYGEPGAPVSYVPEGYGVIMTTVVENDVEHKVYEVRPINE